MQSVSRSMHFDHPKLLRSWQLGLHGEAQIRTGPIVREGPPAAASSAHYLYCSIRWELEELEQALKRATRCPVSRLALEGRLWRAFVLTKVHESLKKTGRFGEEGVQPASQ